MFKERIKKVGLNVLKVLIVLVGFIVLINVLDWLFLLYPAQFNVGLDVGVYTVVGIFLLFCVGGVIIGVIDFIDWLIVEPYQEYKAKKVKE